MTFSVVACFDPDPRDLAESETDVSSTVAGTGIGTSDSTSGGGLPTTSDSPDVVSSTTSGSGEASEASETPLVPPTCGDGNLDPGEECDDPYFLNSNSGDCLLNCRKSRCGDGQVNVAEELCDDGNTLETDACVRCWPNVCGDGYLNVGKETCDDGNKQDGDGCSSACLREDHGGGTTTGTTSNDDEVTDDDASAGASEGEGSEGEGSEGEGSEGEGSEGEGSEGEGSEGDVVGPQIGTLGENDRDFDRALVRVDGHHYIVQNNHWLDNGDLILDYADNSFQVTSVSGAPQSGAPFAFPSIYIGSNGFTDGGQYSTALTDDLPVPISQIVAIPTRFAWGGGTGTFNATYDVWFASPSRTQDLGAVQDGTMQYNDGLDGFLMVWLHNQGGEQPIGSRVGVASIAENTWEVWVGPRGNSPAPDDSGDAEIQLIQSNANASVVSFVAQGTSLNSIEFDLNDFIDAAVSAGHLSGDLILTDVFAGFEIWSGGADLSVQEFRVDVQAN